MDSAEVDTHSDIADGTASAEAPADGSGGADVMLRISHYALLSGLCQFIPVPFADDLAERQVRKRMVAAVLERRGRTFDGGDVKPLWAGVSSGVLKKAGSIARGLILKPVKKALRTVFFVFTIRRALLEAGEVLLLGHTLDRLLAAGWLQADAGAPALRDQSSRIITAVEAAWAGADRRGLLRLLRQSARLLRGWNRDGDVESPSPTTAAVTPTPVADVEDLEKTLSPQQRQRLDQAARELQEQLASEQGRSLLAQFDALVDAHLTGSSSAPRP